jgi:hypothetical protein
MKRVLFLLSVAYFTTSVAQAIITITVEESGSDLVVTTAGGILSFEDFSYDTTYTGYPAYFWDEPSGVITGGNFIGFGNVVDSYTGGILEFSGTPISGGITGADEINQPGPIFGVFAGQPQGRLDVPQGFTSGGTIGASSVTFANASLSDIGWAVGDSATWTWSDGSITLNAVPEPSAYALVFGLAVLGVGLFRHRRKRPGLQDNPNDRTR